MTQEELKQEIVDVMWQEGDRLVAVEVIMKFINQHVSEVIGEDENKQFPAGQTTYAWDQAVRNAFRRALRKRAGL